MATLLIPRIGNVKNGAKKKTLAQRVTVGANTLVILIISLILLVSLSYLMSSNKTAAKGYILKELKEEQKTLAQQANYWALKVSRERSLKSLSSSAQVARMTPAKEIVYMDLSDSKVALLK